MTPLRLRAATSSDLPRVYEVRHGTAENRLTNPALVTDEEVAGYLDQAIFLVSEDAEGVQGFTVAFLTTEPNSVVGPFHPKAMPVILTAETEFEIWMTAPPQEALRLQRPLPDDALRIVARGERSDENAAA